MSIIPPHPSENEFLRHKLEDINKTQFINKYFNEDEHFIRFRNSTPRTNEYEFENSIKGSYMIYLVNNFLMFNEHFLEKDLIQLTNKQIDNMIDAMLHIGDIDFLYDKFMTYLETFTIHQLIYIESYIDFSEIADYITSEDFSEFYIEHDKLFNMEMITDHDNIDYHNLYYDDLEEDIPISQRPKKNKTGYIEDFYLKKNFYTDKENIIHFFKLTFKKCHKSNFTIEELTTIYPNVKIDVNQMFLILQILVYNIEWVDKMKWLLYYLNYEQIKLIGI